MCTGVRGSTSFGGRVFLWGEDLLKLILDSVTIIYYYLA